MIRRLCLALLAGLWLSSGVAFADRAAADYFSQRGDKAIKDKKWAEAEIQFRKALEEDDHHVPARVGLGEALLGTGARDAAVEAWRRAVADAATASPLPAGWADAVARAKKRLTEVDAAGAMLDQMIEKQVGDLVALATKWVSKDPETAGRALRSALILRPAHSRAAAMLAALGPSGSRNPWTTLLAGKDMRGWSNMSFPEWQVLDGAVVGDAKSSSAIGISDAKFSGDHDIRCEAKVLEFYGEESGCLIIGAFKEKHRCMTFGLARGEIVLWDQKPAIGQQPETTTLFTGAYSSLKKPLDPKDWMTLELRFRGVEIHFLLNGEELGVRPRGADHEDGAVAISVQNARVAFRKVEVARR